MNWDEYRPPTPRKHIGAYVVLLGKWFYNRVVRAAFILFRRCPECRERFVDVSLSPVLHGKGCPHGHVFIR